MSDHEVVVIGAGLAGLRAAWRLAEAGRQVTVLEAEEQVGGRERSTLVDGFRIDNGFHVLNPGYPAARRWLDLDALRIREFDPGVLVRRATGLVPLSHPLRRPRSLPATLRSGLLDVRELAALTRWAAGAVVAPQRAAHGPDRTLARGWERAGVHGPLRTEVLEPFLAGVLAEDGQRTSDACVRLLVRSFALGVPGVPAGGIGEVPRQLAGRCRRAGAEIRTGTPVDAVETGVGGLRVQLADGARLTTRVVLVATGPEAAPALTGLAKVPTKGLTTWWFAAESAPPSRMIAVDGRRRGPILNTAVMSAVAPEYAPAGHHLVQATALYDGRTPVADELAREHAADIWGVEADRWRLLERQDIPHALPEQAPPLRTRGEVALGEGLYCCGDHRDTASIQGALVSGNRAAGRILRDLDQPH